MPFYNANLYDLVQTTTFTFTATIVATFETIPDGAKDIPFMLLDGDGNRARIRASFSGGVFTTEEIYSTTELDNSMPTFTAGPGFQGGSSDVAEVIGRALCIPALILSGQSNGPSWNIGKSSLDPQHFQELDNRYKQSTFHQSGRNANYTQGYITGPLDHITVINDPLTLGCFSSFAAELLKEGWADAVCIPAGANSTTISYFNKPGVGYSNLLDPIIEYLNASPNHVIGAWAHLQGESDALFGVTTADDYRDANKTLRDNIAADVLVATGYDMTRTPYLVTGLGPDAVLQFGAHATVIDSGIQEIPDIMDYSAYVTIPANASRNGSANEGGSVDLVHYSAEFQHELGSILLPAALATARKHFVPFGDGLTLNATNPTIPIVGNTGTIETTGDLILNATNPTIPIVGNTGTIETGEEGLTLNATNPTIPIVGNTGTIETTVTISTPLTDALLPDLQLRFDIGVSVDGSNDLTAWDDQSANARVVTIGGAPNSTGTGVNFDGANSEYISIAAITGNLTAGTIIVEYDATSGCILSSGPSALNSTQLNAGSQAAWFKVGALFSNSETIVAPPDFDDGTKRTLAMTVDGSDFIVYDGPKGSLSLKHTETSGVFSAHTSAFEVGRLSTTSASYLTGTIYNILVWDGVALSAVNLDATSGEFAS